MIVHDHIVVVEDEETEGALLGIVTAISPQQLLVETTTGEQAFVINPEKLFPPLPEADQKVAVTYRTLEVHPPQHIATGLVVLPKELDALTMSARGEATQALDSTSGEGTLEPIEAEAEAETAVATVPLAEPEVESEPESLSEDELAAAQTTPETSTQADQPVQEDSFAESTDPAEAELESEAIAENESPTFESEPEAELQAQPEPLAEEQLAESETTFDDDEDALPQTGSSLPLLVGLGALALGLAAVVRSAR